MPIYLDPYSTVLVFFILFVNQHLIQFLWFYGGQLEFLRKTKYICLNIQK